MPESRSSFYNLKELKDRGWTSSLIEDLLGEEDEQRANPYYRSASPTRLYHTERVHKEEKGLIFSYATKDLASKRQKQEQAKEKKKIDREEKAQQFVKRVLLTPMFLSEEALNQSKRQLRQLAVNHYNDHKQDACASINDDGNFLNRLVFNYLYHDGLEFTPPWSIEEEFKSFPSKLQNNIHQKLMKEKASFIVKCYPFLKETARLQVKRWTSNPEDIQLPWETPKQSPVVSFWSQEDIAHIDKTRKLLVSSKKSDQENAIETFNHCSQEQQHLLLFMDMGRIKQPVLEKILNKKLFDKEKETYLSRSWKKKDVYLLPVILKKKWMSKDDVFSHVLQHMEYDISNHKKADIMTRSKYWYSLVKELKLTECGHVSSLAVMFVRFDLPLNLWNFATLPSLHLNEVLEEIWLTDRSSPFDISDHLNWALTNFPQQSFDNLLVAGFSHRDRTQYVNVLIKLWGQDELWQKCYRSSIESEKISQFFSYNQDLQSEYEKNLLLYSLGQNTQEKDETTRGKKKM